MDNQLILLRKRQIHLILGKKDKTLTKGGGGGTTNNTVQQGGEWVLLK